MNADQRFVIVAIVVVAMLAIGSVWLFVPS